ncbi:MAG TPA: hypothetical protein VGE02_12620 [Gemmatimonadales bacterium]
MQIRIIRLQSRNPLVSAALLLAAVAAVVALVIFGLAILAGLTVVGGAALLARRLLGARRRRERSPSPGLDPSREVFRTGRTAHRGELPSVTGRGSP